MISLIAAIGKNNELGKDNDLLWRLPSDQKYFRETTKNHTVIMGRKTFESLDRPLPNRRNIVITRDKTYLRHGVDIVNSLEEALEKARTPLAQNEEIFIIGGADVYKQALPFADKLYITHIDAEDKDANVFFPEINKNEWRKISCKEYKPDEKNLFSFMFAIYQKK